MSISLKALYESKLKEDFPGCNLRSFTLWVSLVDGYPTFGMTSLNVSS